MKESHIGLLACVNRVMRSTQADPLEEAEATMRRMAGPYEGLPTDHFPATCCRRPFRPIGRDCTRHCGLADGNVIPAVRDLSMMLDFDFAEV